LLADEISLRMPPKTSVITSGCVPHGAARRALAIGIRGGAGAAFGEILCQGLFQQHDWSVFVLTVAIMALASYIMLEPLARYIHGLTGGHDGTTMPEQGWWVVVLTVLIFILFIHEMLSSTVEAHIGFALAVIGAGSLTAAIVTWSWSLSAQRGLSAARYGAIAGAVSEGLVSALALLGDAYVQSGFVTLGALAEVTAFGALRQGLVGFFGGCVVDRSARARRARNLGLTIVASYGLWVMLGLLRSGAWRHLWCGCSNELSAILEGLGWGLVVALTPGSASAFGRMEVDS
jgi:hypothetical protein